MRRGRRKVQPETLQGILENYTVPTLRQLAGLLASGLPTRKAGLVALIRKHLENPETLRELWERLDPRQQAAVAEVVHSSTLRFDARGFRAKYGQDPDWGRMDPYGRKGRPSLLRLFIYDGRMPRDLRERLKAFVPPPRTARVRTVDEPPATVSQTGYRYDPAMGTAQRYTEEVPVIRCEMERAALHDVHAVLRLVEAGKVRVSEKTKRVTAAGARAIAKVLQGGDFYPPEEHPDRLRTDPGPIKAFAWPLILQAAGVANLSGNKLQLTRAGKKALTTPSEEVIRRAWDRWLNSRLLDEFNRVHTIKGQTGKGKRGMTSVVERREVIVEALAACPPHEWIAFDEFSRFMRASGYTFEVTRDLWSLYIADPYYGSLGYEGFGGWNILQERYMLAFLFEYAATMGIIDVAYVHPSGARRDYRELWSTDDLDCLSRYDGLLHLRITGLGAWCLGLTEEYVPSAPEVRQVLKVLPNLEVVATVPLDPGDVLMLEQFAEQVGDQVWQIQRTRLLEALEQGYTVADMEAFLRAKASGELPDNVARFFQEMAERASRLVDRGPARLIEVQDAALAQLIVNDRRLRSRCMLAGERYIVVPAHAEDTFRRVLRELGYGLLAYGDRQGWS